MDPLVGRRIEDASLRAWPGLETETLDGWELRCAGGFTKRANSVQPFGPSTGALSEKIEDCEEWYRARGLPAVFRLTPFSDEALDALLEEHGYQLVEPTEVLSMGLGALSKYSAPRELREAGLDEWAQEYATLSDRPSNTVPLLRSILQACRQPCFRGAVSAGDRSENVACGLAVLDQDVVGLFDLVTAEQQRRRGYGTALVAGLLGWGVAQGARMAYLQVVKTNVPAPELYRKLGFTHLYTYWYRVRAA